MYDLILLGSDHQNYCETHFICNPVFLKRQNVLGKDIDPFFAISSINHLVMGFFSIDACCLHTKEGIFNEPKGKSRSDMVYPVTISDSGECDTIVRPLLTTLLYNILPQSKLFVKNSSLSKYTEPLKHLIVEEASLFGFADNSFFEKVENHERFMNDP